MKIWDGTEWVEGGPVSASTTESATPPEDTTLNWIDTSPPPPTPQQLSIQQAMTDITSLLANLAPAAQQAQADIATLSTSTDPLAPILTRVVQGVMELAQGLSDTLVILQLIEPPVSN
jgi:hypothetical protein